jgi:hypothetical protein
MKPYIKLLLFTLLSFFSLTLLKLIIFLFFLHNENNFNYLSIEKNIDYRDFVFKLYLMNIIPIFIYVLIGLICVYKNLKSSKTILITMFLSLILYYFLDVIDVFAFISFTKNILLKTYILVSINTLLILVINSKLKNSPARPSIS